MKIAKVSTLDILDAFCNTPEPKSPPTQQFDRMRSCVMKKQHLTLKLAEQAAAEANKTNTGVYVAYKCRFCDYCHIGHKR